MKLIEFKEYNNLDKIKKLNKKKVAIFIGLIALITIIITFFIIYNCSSGFRNWADDHILMKKVKEGSIPSIELSSDEHSFIYTYDKFVVVLTEGKLKVYNSSAKLQKTMDISINNPVFSSNGKYLTIAEKNKQKVYLISGTKILWSQDIEGNLSRATVNENGYVSVVSAGTTYKSIVTVYSNSGDEILKTYIPSNLVVGSIISSDNNQLSLGEVDTTGNLVKSTVKTLSIKEAQKSIESAILNTYELPTDDLIVNLRYQGSKNLICMCNKNVYQLTDGQKTELLNFENEQDNCTFSSIDLINSIYEIKESTSLTSTVKILNTGTKKLKNYQLDRIAKATSSAGDNIAINCGNEVYFIGTNSHLKKKYIATQEVRNVVVSDSIAVIIFRDKIEILVL